MKENEYWKRNVDMTRTRNQNVNKGSELSKAGRSSWSDPDYPARPSINNLRVQAGKRKLRVDPRYPQYLGIGATIVWQGWSVGE